MPRTVSIQVDIDLGDGVSAHPSLIMDVGYQLGALIQNAVNTGEPQRYQGTPLANGSKVELVANPPKIAWSSEEVGQIVQETAALLIERGFAVVQGDAGKIGWQDVVLRRNSDTRWVEFRCDSSDLRGIWIQIGEGQQFQCEHGFPERGGTLVNMDSVESTATALADALCKADYFAEDEATVSG